MREKEFSILVVDDEPPVRNLLTAVLSPLFECTSVASAGEAIGMLESSAFHLALVDPGLPGMSGIALCRLIVNRFPGTTVIVISGDNDDQSIAEAMTAGAWDYLTKPFNLANLVSLVKRALESNRPGAVA